MQINFKVTQTCYENVNSVLQETIDNFQVRPEVCNINGHACELKEKSYMNVAKLLLFALLLQICVPCISIYRYNGGAIAVIILAKRFVCIPNLYTHSNCERYFLSRLMGSRDRKGLTHINYQEQF